MEPQLTTQAQGCLQGLLRIWFEFERELGKVPLLERLTNERLSNSDYLLLLSHWRQQVIEGSRWISRAASSFGREFAEVRSHVIRHAADEHRDYMLLERDYVAAGGNPADIQQRGRNVGTEALHGFMMYRASQPNPVDMLGAMWIIEGLGQKMANEWAACVERSTQSSGACTQFMRYHGANDGDHMQTFYELLNLVCANDAATNAIWRTAKVVGRLYRLQLEEVVADA